MKRTGLVARVGEEDVFLEQPVRQTSTLLAIRHAYELIPEPCPTCPRRDRALRNRNLHYSISGSTEHLFLSVPSAVRRPSRGNRQARA